jgi:hypothetical protein
MFHDSSEGGFNPLVNSEHTGKLELESRIKTPSLFRSNSVIEYATPSSS